MCHLRKFGCTFRMYVVALVYLPRQPGQFLVNYVYLVRLILQIYMAIHVHVSPKVAEISWHLFDCGSVKKCWQFFRKSPSSACVSQSMQLACLDPIHDETFMLGFIQHMVAIGSVSIVILERSM